MALSLPETSDAVAPATARSAAQIRDWIINEVAQSLRVDPSKIDPHAPMDSLGVSSLAAIGMAGGLTGYLNADLPATLLWDYPSIDALASALAQLAAPAAARAMPPGVLPLQPHGQRCPLFVFPGMGGHPVTFAPLAAELGADQPCFGLTVPGVNEDQVPLTTIEDITAAMVRTLRTIQPRGPYQLAGYSFGGFLAFEAAQQLVAARERVSMLAIYDTFAPGARIERPPWQKLLIHAYLVVARPNRLRYLRDKLSRLVPARRPHKAVVEPTKRPLGQVNWHAAAAYLPRRYPGSIVWFRATRLDVQHMFYRMDRTGGWNALAAGGARIVDLTGDHLDILAAHRASHAADLLRPFLIGAVQDAI
jgi:thioesterase domain-containing protein/acyl carrier protein